MLMVDLKHFHCWGDFAQGLDTRSGHQGVGSREWAAGLGIWEWAPGNGHQEWAPGSGHQECVCDCTRMLGGNELCLLLDL